MKVYICYQINEGAFGGANQFLKSLRDYLLTLGLYTQSIDDADILVFNSMIPYIEIFNLKHKFKDKIFVHRVDGPCKLYNNMSDKRDDMVYRLNNLVADATVFQSNYSRDLSVKMGCPRKKYETTIINACNPSVFYPKSKPENRNERIKLIATSFSDNWNKGFKDYQWLDENLDFERYELRFVGRSPCKFRHIQHIDPQDSQSLANLLRQSDIYITASRFDPCSNSLIEALTCGLPVIALRSGGHPEIVKAGGVLYDNIEEVPSLLERIERQYDTYHTAIQVESMEEVGKKYVEFFEMLISEKKAGRLIPQRLNAFTIAYIGFEMLFDKLTTKLL